MYYILTGPSGLFKTTTIDVLKKLDAATVSGDYREHCAKNGIFLNKLNSTELEMEYILYVFSCMKQGHIHDRGPFDSLLYRYIFSVLKNEITLEEAFSQLKGICERTIRPLTENKICKVFYFIPTNIKTMILRMERRCDDPWTNKSLYAKVQVDIFTYVGQMCGWYLYEINSFQDVKKFVDDFLYTINPFSPKDSSEFCSAVRAVQQDRILSQKNRVWGLGTQTCEEHWDVECPRKGI